MSSGIIFEIRGDRVENGAEPTRIGRSEDVIVLGSATGVGICVEGDSLVAPRHCEFRRTGQHWSVVDLDSWAGTLVNGRKHRFSVLSDGDEIRVGNTRLVVRFAGESEHSENAEAPATAEPPGRSIFLPPPPALAVQPPGEPTDPRAIRFRSELLLAADDLVYAIVDGAQAFDVAVGARATGHPVHTLFEGAMAATVAHKGPCVVENARSGAFLDTWVTHLGRSAGVVLKTRLPIEELKRVLRNLFIVRDQTEQEYFFRFYDPRVLRVFLGTAARDQLTEFFVAVPVWVAECEDGKGWMFYSCDQSVLRERCLDA